jgi:3-hydroxyisobutyrate dehydrogenase-like beta-hydroxyacid dehydrogenase
MSAAGMIGCIGLGVMGEPICRNLVQKSGQSVIGFDTREAPLARLAAQGVCAAAGVAEVMREADFVFLSLPSGREVAALCAGAEGLPAQARRGQIIVDLGTSPPALARDLAERFAARGAGFADAPVARTRAAAERGELSVMVGAAPEIFAALRPLLENFATDITHCGPPGAGQVVKILNNMVLAETVVALSEALAIARGEGVDGALLFEALARGSADSFALRNHGMKALLPGEFPERAFSAVYARKDLGYALDLARAQALPVAGAENAAQLLERAIAAGDGERYWPVLSRAFTRSR